jgi:hypothetical protein
MFLWSAEAAALPRGGPNRDSLVDGLQEGATDVCFKLKGCNDAEFAVLCKAMAVLGPAVRRVVSEDPSPASRGDFQAYLHIDAFVVALAPCSRLVELRWVLCVPCLAATACLQVHVRRVGDYGGWLGVIVCCRLQGRSFVENTQLGKTGGVAIAGALQHVPSLTVLEYVVGEGASGVVAGCSGCGGGSHGVWC